MEHFSTTTDISWFYTLHCLMSEDIFHSPKVLSQCLIVDVLDIAWSCVTEEQQGQIHRFICCHRKGPKKKRLFYFTSPAVHPSWSTLSQKLVQPTQTQCTMSVSVCGKEMTECLRWMTDCQKQWHQSGYIISFLLISFTTWLVLCDAFVSCWGTPMGDLFFITTSLNLTLNTAIRTRFCTQRSFIKE